MKIIVKIKYEVLLISILIFISCSEKYKTIYQGEWSDLDLLPADTGGEHRGFLGSEYSGANNGFYMYLPKGYESSPIKYPTIIFLHGGGDSANSMESHFALSMLLNRGIPDMITKGIWNPPVPFIVISPQIEKKKQRKGFDKTLNSLIKEYPIDTSRIYATGLSMGGYIVWDTLAYNGERTYVAAGVPVRGTVNEFQKNQDFYSGNLTGFPIWAFHSEYDYTVPTKQDRGVVEVVNKLNPVFRVKYRQFPVQGHDKWDLVYHSKLDTKTDPNYDPFDMDIYSWMLQFRRVKK